MKYELVIFDLDGTLLDTLDDLTHAVNHALRLQGLPLRSREAVRLLIGNGIASTVRRAIPAEADGEAFAKALSDFRSYYFTHVNVYTRPYDGIVGLLDEMGDAGIKAAVNSNKADAATQSLCQAHMPGRFAFILGEQPDIPKKPAPDGALTIMRALGASPARTLYVGDSKMDMLCGGQAGMATVGVTWGFRDREELIENHARFLIDRADELPGLIWKDEA